jgi:DNA mismatch repair ATPase MutS
MPKTSRPHKFQLRLSDDEWEKAEAMAKREGLTRSDLFRLKTIYCKLPRRVTQVAADTYWQLSQEANNLNQIAKALNTANKSGRLPKSQTLRELQNSLLNNLELLTQVRKELVELDLMAQLSEWESEDDW